MTEAINYRQVARIHIESIGQGFLSTLGERFLALMYQAIDECCDAVLLVEMEQGIVRGFVSGATGMGPIYKQMLLHAPRLVWTLAPVLIKPRKISRIIEILRHSNGGGDVVDNLPPYELLSIAVLSDARRGGVAQRLYSRLVQHFTAIGASGFRIVVGESLGPAHRFYTRMGAEPKCKISVHGDEMSLVYVHNLRQDRVLGEV